MPEKTQAAGKQGISALRIRATLFTGSLVIVLIALVFLYILNLNQPADLKKVFLEYIVVLFVCSALTLAAFMFKGPLFSVEGELRDGIVTTIVLTILIIVQVAFAFGNFAYRQMMNSFDAFDGARDLYARIDWNQKPKDLNASLQSASILKLLPPNIDQIYIVDAQSKVVFQYGSGEVDAKEELAYKATERYVFPFNGGYIGMHISEAYSNAALRRILIDLSTLIVTGLFFGFELIMFMMQYIKRKIAEAGPEKENLPNAGFFYVRQLAFFFYFASRMAVAFIPLLAAKLLGDAVGKGSVAASMPQSAETLFTCAAIFATSELIIRKGWKVPFLAGLALVAGGTLLSGLANSIIVFIISRAIVGLGYGFCWMTLRNLAILGRDAGERNMGFALMNAGLYAGKNCGSVLGSILADSVGYNMVFFIAAGLTVLCVIAVLKLENGGMQTEAEKKEALEKAAALKAQQSSLPLAAFKDYLPVLYFLILLILPACIMESYTSYFMPLYTVSLGFNTSDVGRLQLVYGLILVYIAPKLSQLIRNKMGDSIAMSAAYNGLLAAALIITGLIGGLGIEFAAVILIAMGDGFGFGAQNNFFLAIPVMTRMPGSRSLSWLSFFKKFAGMLGPLAFALLMLIPGNKGLLILGVLMAVMALGTLKIKSLKPGQQLKVDSALKTA
jgi:predicted MFS family arabinose efflux permease